ncbi:MFS transporter [Streptosporangium nondiastaticum]|uniref:MFS transporter n=1 Tax=Streptosporangium nondiastaticum TaxID=35764 RepID=A0A9X7JP81_9ACTN|nr:MFS transporter [Streptosporangium nondiastaticum]PSJ27379.1 MFS transporter [Streptosporangium nondiastaticum]
MPHAEPQPTAVREPAAPGEPEPTASQEEAASPEGAASREAAAPPSLWRNRDYMAWWTGNGLSVLGNSVSSISYPLLVLATTGSVARAGVITAATMLGSLLTTLLGGALADRVSRRAILLCSPLVQALVLGTIALLVRSGEVSVPLLAAAAAVSGMASGLAMGAMTPALRRIVPREQVGAATAQGLGRDMTAQLVGSPLGGLLFSVSRWFPFAADAVSYLFAALGVALVRKPLGPGGEAGEVGEADKSKKSKDGLFADMAAGLRLVRSHPYLRFTVVWGALLNAVAQGFFLLFVALVKHRGGGPATVGLVNSMALAGGVLGAIAGPLVLKRMRARRVVIVALWVFVESFAVVAFVPEPWQIGCVLLVAMTTMVPLNVVLESYEVRLVPDEYSGRVAAVTRFGMQALQWTGPLAAGFLADAFDVPGAILALMVVMAGLAVSLHLSRPTLAVLDRPLDEVEEMAVPGAERRSRTR